MNKNDLYNALSGINKDFIAESENFDAVAADFRKDKIRKIGITATTLCLAVLCVGMIGIFSKVTPKRNNHPTEENNIVISTDVSQTESSVQTAKNVSEQATSCMMDIVTSETINSDITVTKESIHINQTESIKVTSEPATDAAQSAAKQTSAKTNSITQSLSKQTSTQTNATIQTVTEQTTSPNNENGNKLYYSQLVKNTGTPVLDGYEGSFASMDIMAFDDSRLNEAIAVVESEILDMWVNHYEYATASNKFEPNGRIYHKPSTVAYKIRVDKVYSGDFSIGDIIVVEDYNFILDSVISIKTGGTYVIPIAQGEGVLRECDEVVSGNNILESSYYTYYQFHPQIEKVSGGYVVPGDWKTLITDECTEIIMDIDNSFYAGMYYVLDGVFNDRISLIL